MVVSGGVKTRGEILEENNARLQFVKEKLEHVDEGQALAFLQERHREFLEGVLIREDEPKGEAAETHKPGLVSILSKRPSILKVCRRHT